MVHFRKHKDLPEVAITVTFQTFFRLTILIVLAIVLLSALHKASHALLLIFTAFFLALALNGPVSWVSRHLPGKRRGNRSLATGLSVLLVAVFLGAFIASIVPPLVRQTQSFVSVAPRLVRDLRSQDSEVGHLIRRYHLEKQVDTFSNQLSVRIKNSGGAAFSTAKKVASSMFSVLTILVLTFMMLVEGPRWLSFAREVVPDRHHTIGAVIVTTVALFHSTSSAIIILAYYILYQQIENYFIQPKIQANSTNMSPLLVFMAVVVGVSFGGLFGGLVAIPLAGCIRIALLEYLRTEKIIDTPEFKSEVTPETR
jgi:predicted PurR-regulated permease PerM